MIPRKSAEKIKELLQGFPIVTVTGPRQSGKTTLARAIFKDRPYASLEDPDLLAMAIEDPRGFLARFPDGGVIDEVQRAPKLLSFLQTLVDSDSRQGQFLLTGSQQFDLLSNISQSLAGRSAFLELLPLSIAELTAAGQIPKTLDRLFFTGGYPALYQRNVKPYDWFSAYIRAYLERDVRQILNVKDLYAFQRFLKLCAGRSGQIVNMTALANECALSMHVVRNWISVLQASYVVFLLEPYFENFNKRTIKAPKLYFWDTGLLCALLGVQDSNQLSTHPLRGAIFETMVTAEFMKAALNSGQRPNLFFWRDNHGHEIDLLQETMGPRGPAIRPIEIKAAQTVHPDFFRGLNKFEKLAGEKVISPTLVFGGEPDTSQKDFLGVQILSWRCL